VAIDSPAISGVMLQPSFSLMCLSCCPHGR
jgi:hypothetical protein